MTNGEKEKAFKNLQTTLFHLNQKRIGKGKLVLDTLPFKEEEKRKSDTKEFVSGLPLTLHSVVLPLQLPTKSLKNSVFQKSFSFFSSKKKLSQHSLIEVKFSLLSSIDTNLQSPLNQRKEREEVKKKEKGWCLCSLKSSAFGQNSFSKSEKKKPLTFAPLLGESTWFFQQQRLPSIQEERPRKRSLFFFNPHCLSLSFKDLSMLGKNWVSFSPFLREGTQKENKIENKKERVLFSSLLLGEESGKPRSTLLTDPKQPVLRREKEVVDSLKSNQPFPFVFFQKSLEKEVQEVLFQNKRKVKEGLGLSYKKKPLPVSWPGFSKFFFPLFLFCRAGLSFLPPLWVCFKRGKNRKPLCFQRKDSSMETDPLTQKQPTLTPSKEKQKVSLLGDGIRKVTKRNQKPKDNNPILTIAKEGKIEENKHPFHLRILYKGVSQVRPLIEVRKVRKGGNTFQVPAFVKKGKGEKMGLTWLIEKGREKSRKTTLSFSESLCSNLLQSFEKSGEARQKRDQLLRLALSNRPYSRFRWW